MYIGHVYRVLIDTDQSYSHSDDLCKYPGTYKCTNWQWECISLFHMVVIGKFLSYHKDVHENLKHNYTEKTSQS